MERLDLIKTINSSVLGEQIWAAVGGHGSYIRLNLGKKIPREREIGNDKLEEDVRKYNPEICFDIYCNWELFQNGKHIVKSSDDDIKFISHLIQSVQNKRIKQCILTDNLDCTLKIEDEFLLQISCIGSEDGDWLFEAFGTQYLIVNNRVEKSS